MQVDRQADYILEKLFGDACRQSNVGTLRICIYFKLAFFYIDLISNILPEKKRLQIVQMPRNSSLQTV